MRILVSGRDPVTLNECERALLENYFRCKIDLRRTEIGEQDGEALSKLKHPVILPVMTGTKFGDMWMGTRREKRPKAAILVRLTNGHQVVLVTYP